MKQGRGAAEMIESIPRKNSLKSIEAKAKKQEPVDMVENSLRQKLKAKYSNKWNDEEEEEEEKEVIDDEDYEQNHLDN